jgi:hypothetical protein
MDTIFQIVVSATLKSPSFRKKSLDLCPVTFFAIELGSTSLDRSFSGMQGDGADRLGNLESDSV